MVEEKYQETQWQPVIVERSRQVPIVTTVTRQRLTAPTTQVQVGCVDCNCVQTRTPVATVQVGECVDCQPAPRRVQQVAVDCVDCQNGYAAPGGVDVDVNVGRQRRGLFGWFRRRGCR